jgi:hypothetical protein
MCSQDCAWVCNSASATRNAAPRCRCTGTDGKQQESGGGLWILLSSGGNQSLHTQRGQLWHYAHSGVFATHRCGAVFGRVLYERGVRHRCQPGCPAANCTSISLQRPEAPHGVPDNLAHVLTSPLRGYLGQVTASKSKHPSRLECPSQPHTYTERCMECMHAKRRNRMHCGWQEVNHKAAQMLELRLCTISVQCVVCCY